MQVGNFLSLNVRFFWRLNIRRHVTFPHLCIILFNSSITVTTIKAKVFILLKRLNHISNLHSWMVCSVLCFLKWLISDWLIDWLWLTNESINQQTDWLVIYLWLLLVLEICMYFGDAFQIQNKCSNLSKRWVLLLMFQHLFNNILYYYCNDISEYTYWAADSMMLMASSLNSFSNGVLSLDFP